MIIDMVQFGPCDFAMSIGLPEQRNHPKAKESELKTINTVIQMRIRPRVEFRSIDYSLVNIRKYIDLDVKDFHLPIDLVILHQWHKKNPIAINELFENNLISNMD